FFRNGRRGAFDLRQKIVQSFDITRSFAFKKAIVFAADLPKYFRLVRRRKILLGMMKTNQAIPAAVYDKHRHPDARQFAARVIFDCARPERRQPGKQLAPQVCDTCVSALKNQSTERLAQRQFAGDAAAERFAERDYIRRRKALLPQPLVRRLRVEISAFLVRPALAATVTAIVENENSCARLQQRRHMIEPVTDVPSVAMTKQIDKMLSRRACVGGKKPAV